MLYCFISPGDIIMADQGFTYNEHAPMAMSKPHPSLEERSQLEKVDTNRSRELSAVRIHVERIIGVLKQ